MSRLSSAHELGGLGELRRLPASDARPRPLRILCAEDNPYGRIVLRTIAEAFGHTTDFVGNGEAAIRAAAAGTCDLVLMDVTLPGIDGIEATRRIREASLAGRTLPIIGVSGHDDDALRNRALAAGMNAYLVKPISPAALGAAIAAVMAE